MSYGEQIALSGGAELSQAAAAAQAELRTPAEAHFLERLKAGDPACFELLVNERSGEVYSLLCRLTDDPEEAKDLTQETFLRAFQSIAKFRGDADLKTWLYQIALNQARNRWRWWKRRRRDVTVSIELPVGDRGATLAESLEAKGGCSPETETINRERERLLNQALASLRGVYKEAVVLRDIEGMSYEEIATALEISVGTVKSRLARGREELRRRLGVKI